MNKFIKEAVEMFSMLFASYSNTRIEKQRFLAFILSSLTALFLIPFNIIGFAGSTEIIIRYFNAAHWFLCLIPFILFLYKKISLERAFIIYSIGSQLLLSVKMIFLSTVPTNYNIHLIIANQTISVLISFIAIIAYIRKLPFLIMSVSLSTYILCTLISQSYIMQNLFLLFVFIQTTTRVLGEIIVKDVNIIEQENLNYKKEELEIMHILRLNKDQIKAYVKLCNNDNATIEDVDEMFGMFDKRSQRNIVNAVTMYNKDKNAKLEIIAKVCPELSPSELEVCRLIMMDKKLSDIGMLLNKTDNNVNAHRGHIRKKLGLKKEENIKDVIERRISESKKRQK